jgi:hypothetical protein
LSVSHGVDKIDNGDTEGACTELSTEVEGAEIVHCFTKIVAVVDGNHRSGAVVLQYRLHVGQVRPADRGFMASEHQKFLSHLVLDGSELAHWRSRRKRLN